MFFQAKHQKRFIYFRGEIPEFGSEALSEIKAEEGLEESLDTAQLLDASNQLIVSYADRLAKLPEAFRTSIHDNVVRYFQTSSIRYDHDLEEGFDAIEFDAYSRDMQAKLNDILDQYAPSEELLAAREAQQESTMEAAEQAHEIEAIDVDEAIGIAVIDTPEAMSEALDVFESHNKGFREAASTLLEKAADFHESLQKFEEGKQKWSVFLRGGSFFSDDETEDMRIILERLKVVFAEKMQKMETKQTSISLF